MKRLQHLTSTKRDKITILQGEGLSIKKIAKEIGRFFNLIVLRLLLERRIYFT